MCVCVCSYVCILNHYFMHTPTHIYIYMYRHTQKHKETFAQLAGAVEYTD